MEFNEDVNNTGLIQECEFWTGKNYGDISGDTELLQTFTNRLNRAFDKIMPSLLSLTGFLRFDDANNTDLPVGTFDIVSGQVGYSITTDDNGLEILNITNVRILPNAGATNFKTLTEITADDPRAIKAMSPNPNDIGIPTHYYKRGNQLFFLPNFNYSQTGGGKVFFERIQNYFVSGDTTKKPGIPGIFHMLLALIASHAWLLVNKSEETVLIGNVANEIAVIQNSLQSQISTRYPTRGRITVRQRGDRRGGPAYGSGQSGRLY